MTTNNKQYFSFDKEEGFKFHETMMEAVNSARGYLAEYRAEASCGEKWNDDVEKVCWGIIASQSQMVDIGPDPEHGGWVVNYLMSDPVITTPDHRTTEEEFSKSTESAQCCGKCGQQDAGQTGEYPCSDCGIPIVYDAHDGAEAALRIVHDVTDRLNAIATEPAADKGVQL